MSTSWTKKEDEQLMEMMRRGQKKGWNLQHLFLSISQKLQRSPEECIHRWQMLNDQEKWGKIEKRIDQLEQTLQNQRAQLEKMKKDMKFYELMLLEEYHLLLKLLGEDPQNIRIHRI